MEVNYGIQGERGEGEGDTLNKGKWPTSSTFDVNASVLLDNSRVHFGLKCIFVLPHQEGNLGVLWSLANGLCITPWSYHSIVRRSQRI